MPTQPDKLKGQTILHLINSGNLLVDIDTGEICLRGEEGGYRRSTHTLTPNHNIETGFDYVRISFKDKTIDQPVHELVWMAGAGTLIPQNWVVVHLDSNVEHNTWNNLICLHKDDLLKIEGIEVYLPSSRLKSMILSNPNRKTSP